VNESPKWKLSVRSQDRFNRWKYEAGLAEPEHPGRRKAPMIRLSRPGSAEAVPTASHTSIGDTCANQCSYPILAGKRHPRQIHRSATPSPAAWIWPAFGGLAEGVWQPYIANPGGVVALRVLRPI
jgi:hypothetical protein